MLKGPKDILILILAALCLGVSLVFMPWCELNFTGNFPDWLNGVTSHFGIDKFFAGLSAHNKLMEIIKSCHAPSNLGDYAYSLFLFGAMTVAAVAIILIGKEENSEKTVLEAKK
jgi:hypothetical protein